ncbi:hypothetical protein G6F50_016882 [Rhizopus delemar]|uniref:Uncharacterized protein n=1 Tax=Rhizopus delemar TaxID=936053 RepID=A0A9P6XS65_9FUNG|nr:hypothetical protein G6F50_016882 [Rhizopus delemar]
MGVGQPPHETVDKHLRPGRSQQATDRDARASRVMLAGPGPPTRTGTRMPCERSASSQARTMSASKANWVMISGAMRRASMAWHLRSSTCQRSPLPIT